MGLNNNIFCCQNPAMISDALWDIMRDSNVDLVDMLIFLPSRRAVRSVEKMLVQKAGGALLLPHLVALGEGVDDPEFETEIMDADVVSNSQRVVVLSKLLAADAAIGGLANALPIARDLVRMTDYLENEGVDAQQINWGDLVDEKYAEHFQHKAKLLNILSQVLPAYYDGRVTETARRNADIRAWKNALNKYKLVIVCASTASVPATADLMESVAKCAHGKIILSGKIFGNVQDFELNTNPYNSEYKFLQRIGATPADVTVIGGAASEIDFFNLAFTNSASYLPMPEGAKNCHLVECGRESEEAEVVAEISARAIKQNKSVLIITPDAAGNQRIAMAMKARNIDADFSSGVPGNMVAAGRAILNLFDNWVESGASVFDKLYREADNNLFEMIVRLVDSEFLDFAPRFDFADAASIQIWDSIKQMSDCLRAADVCLNLLDAQAFITDAISSVSVRGIKKEDAKICVLGTIESRMQGADVIILTGLNDGMFPSRGYENAWLPRHLTEKIGLPSADRKVSLMSLDFMNLSCGGEVYWTRSKTSGGSQTTESRFISRVRARGAIIDMSLGADILKVVRDKDIVAPRPMDYSAPTPPADWSDIYVTELDALIHNPYVFYAKHILKLRPRDDYWLPPDARDFGNLVHDVIENATDFTPDNLVKKMDARAREILGRDNIIFHFWHKRFLEIAPFIANEFECLAGSLAEIPGVVKIAGRNIRARADRVWDNGVLDIKTGLAPNETKLLEAMAPQLPLEAYMLQNGGFSPRVCARPKTPVMVFLQLKSGNVDKIKYEGETLQNMINAAVLKTTELINIYSAGNAPYEYRETSDLKYKIYDDLARRFD